MHWTHSEDLYLKQTMASGVIPQITAVFGTCGGGLSVVPALTDFTFMEEKKGRLFVNSPNAIPGNKIQDAIQHLQHIRKREQVLSMLWGQRKRLLRISAR